MSTLIIEVCEVIKVEKHPNADRLEISTVKGWKTCTKKGSFKEGDKCVFFPPDSILPPEIAEDRLGIMNYLAELPKDESGIRPPGGRVRATRLRGYPSYGVIMAVDPEFGDDPNWEVGTDVADHFGVTKWEPPLRCNAGDADREHVRFPKYTNIESYGNFPDSIPEGELVVISEKIHGTNNRIGLVLDDNEEGEASWAWMAGSHSVRRKEENEKGRPCLYWEPLTDKIKEMLEYVRDTYAKSVIGIDEDVFSVVVYCEIYGSGIQDLAYGYENGRHGFRVFDISINLQYIDHHHKVYLCDRFEIERVVPLYRGEFTSDIVDEYTSGPTKTCEEKKAGKFKGREGIVITPIKEQNSYVLNGRMILKSVSPDYIGRKDGTDGH